MTVQQRQALDEYLGAWLETNVCRDGHCALHSHLRLTLRHEFIETRAEGGRIAREQSRAAVQARRRLSLEPHRAGLGRDFAVTGPAGRDSALWKRKTPRSAISGSSGCRKRACTVTK